MRRRLAWAIALSLVVECASLGCATFERAPSPSDEEEAVSTAMTASEMELVFASQVAAIEGPPGAIRTKIDDFNVYLVSDPAADRMQIMMPISMAEGLDRRVLNVLLEANFQNTLDARYAISEGVVYGIYLHPISTLTPEMIRSALAQVVRLGRTYGTSFSAREPMLRFRQNDGR